MNNSKKIIVALCAICTILACAIIVVALSGTNEKDNQTARVVSGIEQIYASSPPRSVAEAFQSMRETWDIDVNEVALMRNFHFDVPEEFMTSISGITVEHGGDTLVFRTSNPVGDDMLVPQHLNDRALNYLAAMLVETGQMPVPLVGRELMSWLHNRGVEVSYFNIPFRPFPSF